MITPDKLDKRVPVMLSIAGSDPSGGAGIQADIKTATAVGVYCGAVITSLTAQNTEGVTAVWPVDGSCVYDQYVSVVTDLNVRAVKIGMLGTSTVVEAVVNGLRRYPVPHVVLDPVMVASSGDRLIDDDAVDAIRQQLLPLATLITPNLPEAGALLNGSTPDDEDSMIAAALALTHAGATAALVKGGHLDGDASDDVLVDDRGTRWYRSPRIATSNTHGTGCTLSSAVASMLTRGTPLREAIRGAKDYLTGALQSGADRHVGSGRGPVDHLWRLEAGARER